MRFALFIALSCVAVKLTEGIHIEEVIVVNTTDGKITEDVTIDTNVGKSSRKTDRNSGIITIKYDRQKDPKKTPATPVTNRKRTKKVKHHRHLRRRCCQAGELAVKHGLSCVITRNFKNQFFNLVTQTRQKFQGVLSQHSGARSKIRSKTMYDIYHTIKGCVKRQKKGVVQKCCLAYRLRYRG